MRKLASEKLKKVQKVFCAFKSKDWYGYSCGVDYQEDEDRDENGKPFLASIILVIGKLERNPDTNGPLDIPGREYEIMAKRGESDKINFCLSGVGRERNIRTIESEEISEDQVNEVLREFGELITAAS